MAEELISLSSLLVPSKAVEVDYPGLDGLKISVAFLSREELVKLRKKATKIVYKNRVQTDELNEDLFLKLYTESVVKGWTGFKYKYLQDLLLVDLSNVKDAEACLPFNIDNALALMKGSVEFDSFISETVNDLSVFSRVSKT